MNLDYTFQVVTKSQSLLLIKFSPAGLHGTATRELDAVCLFAFNRNFKTSGLDNPRREVVLENSNLLSIFIAAFDVSFN